MSVVAVGFEIGSSRSILLTLKPAGARHTFLICTRVWRAAPPPLCERVSVQAAAWEGEGRVPDASVMVFGDIP